MMETGKAPNLELVTIEGLRFSLAEQLGQSAVVLVFFKIGCPTCQFTLPFLQRLYGAQFPGSPCLFGISQDKADATSQFNEHFAIRFPVLLDEAADNYAASNAYRITSVPSLFLIETNGQIAWSLSGFDRAELDVLGERFGRSPFEKGEQLPASRPG